MKKFLGEQNLMAQVIVAVLICCMATGVQAAPNQDRSFVFELHELYCVTTTGMGADKNAISMAGVDGNGQPFHREVTFGKSLNDSGGEAKQALQNQILLRGTLAPGQHCRFAMALSGKSDSWLAKAVPSVISAIGGYFSDGDPHTISGAKAIAEEIGNDFLGFSAEGTVGVVEVDIRNVGGQIDYGFYPMGSVTFRPSEERDGYHVDFMDLHNANWDSKRGDWRPHYYLGGLTIIGTKTHAKRFLSPACPDGHPLSLNDRFLRSCQPA
jgi:hypothetical protein